MVQVSSSSHPLPSLTRKFQMCTKAQTRSPSSIQTSIPINHLNGPIFQYVKNIEPAPPIAASKQRPMSYTIIGKYRLGRTIGEGAFAKVRLAMNIDTRKKVAIKIIDKNMVLENKLMGQVKREISTMKLLHHPNIVKIYEVIGTKSKIHIIMEYVSGGQLSNKLAFYQRLDEREARKFFQQLIDAVDYCHGRGVCHRDLKPGNLLLDSKGTLKVADFGLCVRQKAGELLSTTCGSPSYVAPEVIVHKSYEGAAADIWSCGIILFELLAGYLPFRDGSLLNLYRKITKADYKFPDWFTAQQKRLIVRILNPLPTKRATIADILGDEWFRIDYEPFVGNEKCEENTNPDSVTFDGAEEASTHTTMESSHGFISAFQLIAMSDYLNLSGLFEDNNKEKTKLGSTHSMDETVKKIQEAAKGISLSVERMNNSKLKVLGNKRLATSKLHFTLSAEVIEITPIHCIVELSKYTGEKQVYKELCENLSSMLRKSSSEPILPASKSTEE